MAVVTQPQAEVKLVTPVAGHRDWSTGKCACFTDAKSCIMTFCCLPLTLCHISSRIGDCPLMPFFVPSAIITMRTRIRTLGGIQGSICDDCMAFGIFTACVICQMARELDNMGL